MNRIRMSAAALALTFCAPALAVNADRFEIPYFGMAGEVLVTDSKRAADDGLGYQFSMGVPLTDPRNAVELRFADAKYQRNSDGRDNYQTTLFVDYVRDFGAIGDGSSFFTAIKPYAALGLGFVQEDVKSDKTMHGALSAGGGVLMPFSQRGLALRLDARAQPQSNRDSVPRESALVDYVVTLGLSIPMTLFYDKPVVLPAATDCPVAVVDAESGRSDCVADSDQDGVKDTRDQCPGTPLGSTVDANGCTREPESVDADKDGVLDRRDQCPGTPLGLKVDDTGCVIAQKSALRGVTFLLNKATLTEEGRTTLDAVADTLKQQDNLKVEIAGHTDSIGSESYNTLLSQQRADSVRTYLIGKGIEDRRMTAVGYGELEPVAGNDTDEGRKANRRVEFRITTE